MNLVQTGSTTKLEAPYSYCEEDLNKNFKRRFTIIGTNHATGETEKVKDCLIHYVRVYIGAHLSKWGAQFFTKNGYPVLCSGLLSEIHNYKEQE